MSEGSGLEYLTARYQGVKGLKQTFRLIRELVRPYRGQLFVILLAMFVKTAMSLAGPWPLKIIIDNVIGNLIRDT